MIDVASMSMEQLVELKRTLLAEVAVIGRAPADTAEGMRREAALEGIRLINDDVKRRNVEAASRKKSRADRRRARGLAEHAENMQRAGAPIAVQPAPALAPPHTQTLGQFILWQATKLRASLRKVRAPAQFTTEFAATLSAFITEQAAHCRLEAAGGDDAWRETWAVGAHHHRDDLACPACGTDSTAGCIAEPP